jgi:hypothetical protein
MTGTPGGAVRVASSTGYGPETRGSVAGVAADGSNRFGYLACTIPTSVMLDTSVATFLVRRCRTNQRDDRGHPADPHGGGERLWRQHTCRHARGLPTRPEGRMASLAKLLHVNERPLRFASAPARRRCCHRCRSANEAPLGRRATMCWMMPFGRRGPSSILPREDRSHDQIASRSSEATAPDRSAEGRQCEHIGHQGDRPDKRRTSNNHLSARVQGGRRVRRGRGTPPGCCDSVAGAAASLATSALAVGDSRAAVKPKRCSAVNTRSTRNLTSEPLRLMARITGQHVCLGRTRRCVVTEPVAVGVATDCGLTTSAFRGDGKTLTVSGMAYSKPLRSWRRHPYITKPRRAACRGTRYVGVPICPRGCRTRSS